MDQPFLRLEGVTKTFPGVVANNNISLEVRTGEVHCLLGENGAGKSTLMNILYGLCQPDQGEIYVRGQRRRIHSPRDAIAAGIGMVHQHFMLVPTLTVAENMILGQYPPWKVLNDLKDVAKRIRELSREYGLEVEPDALVSDLSVGEQQRVEILKALYHGSELLILDEPTAVLTPQETTQLLTLLRALADRGVTIIFITHKLDEVMLVSDRVTVLRDGQVVATVPRAEVDLRALARMMVGRDVQFRIERPPVEPGETLLSVRDLIVRDERGLPAVKGVSFDVRAGEIVGIAGVSGNGQRELSLALAGLMEATYREITICGKSLTRLTPQEVSRHGLAHIPEDRHGMGLILPFTVAENYVLESYNARPYARWGFLNYQKIRDHAQVLVTRFGVRVSDVGEAIANLSGGNQQKVVVARELERTPRVLLVNQPTRGIDIGATEFVHQQILAQRAAGTAILLLSTDLEEIFNLSDRILVMYEGEIIGEVPGDRRYLDTVGLMMAGTRIEVEQE